MSQLARQHFGPRVTIHDAALEDANPVTAVKGEDAADMFLTPTVPLDPDSQIRALASAPPQSGDCLALPPPPPHHHNYHYHLRTCSLTLSPL